MNFLEKFGIVPNNPELFEIAFTHGSYGTIHGLDYSYERLEFLGDSVLNLIVSEYLIKKYPECGEGDLTKIRANYVCQKALIHYSHELKLDAQLKVSTDEEYISNHEILSIQADVFESFLGAIFLDQGMEFAKNFVADAIFKYIDDEIIFFHDYKSLIKEYGDAEEVSIEYNVVDEYGVPHDKTFIISILIDGEEMGIGEGKSKKEAEQFAAQKAASKLNIG